MCTKVNSRKYIHASPKVAISRAPRKNVPYRTPSKNKHSVTICIDRQPSHELYNPNAADSDETNENTRQTGTNQSSRIKYGKHNDRATDDMMKLQSTTKLLIPRLPFQW